MDRLRASIVAMLMMMASSLWADVNASRPGWPDKPTKIYATMSFIDLDEVDTPKQSFTANIYFEFRWVFFLSIMAILILPLFL